MDERLQCKIDEVVAYAQENGWQTHVESLPEVEGCREAVCVGGIWGLVDEVGIASGQEFLFTLGYAINTNTNRVVTLEQGDSGARFVIAVDDDSGRYWWSRKADWKNALADPLDWCHFDPSERTGASR